MPIYSLDYAFKQEADQLSQQVVVAQFFGSLLLVVPALWLPFKFTAYGLVSAFFVLLYTFSFVCFWYRDCLFGQPVPPRLRLNQIRNSLVFLVSLDSAVILFVTGATGGVAQSHLTGVLLLIPCVMSIVAIKPSVFVRISLGLGTILFTSLFFYGISRQDPLIILCRRLGLFCDISSVQVNYLQAVAFVAILSIALIVIERRVIKPRLRSDDWSFNEIIHLSSVGYEGLLGEYINKGFNRYKRCLEETNIPDPHISLVHNPQATFSQAYILAYPSYRRGKLKDAEDIAFVTFATHWIDDCFDAIYIKEILDAIDEEQVQSLTLKTLCDRIRGFGIDIMSQHILHHDCAKDKAAVESGLFRVMLAGLIQHAPKDIEDELTKLYREECKKKLDLELAEKIDSLEIRPLLAMARTSFSLILGCESPKNSEERKDLMSLACIFDLILCPLVLFHDLQNEERWEEGTLPKYKENLPNELIEMAKLAVKKLSVYINQDVMRGAVRAQQLRMVSDLYLPLIPEDGNNFKERYKEQLEAFIKIFAKGHHDAYKD